MKTVQMRRKSALVPLTHTEYYQQFHRYAGVVRGANAYIPPGARKTGSIEESSKPDIPKVSINGPDGATVTPQASNSNGTTPTPAIVSILLLWRIPNNQLERSPPVMPLSLLSVISSVARSKDSLRRSKPSSGLSATNGPRILSSSASHSRLVSRHISDSG